MINLTDIQPIVQQPRKLGELADGIAKPDADVEISGICDDSRQLRVGEAFLCLPRARDHVGSYLAMAKEHGAAAVIIVGDRIKDCPLPALYLKNMQQAGKLLRRWFGTETTETRCIGITGTDGKTSVAWMLREALHQLQGKAWSVGTLGLIRTMDDIADLGMTTPSLLNMHRLLALAHQDRVPTLVAEVSSHGIEQERIAGLDMQAAVWTSIGHDHLQYHGGFAAYAGIKESFVRSCAQNGGSILANADHAEIKARAPVSTRWYGHGLYRKDVTIGWEQELPGMMRITADGKEVLIEDIPLGEFHAENLAAVALMLTSCFDVPVKKLPALLSGISVPPGRLQDLSTGRWRAFVDYAHTPEALERCLITVRKLTRRRLLLVFGCGGERDREKRPQMGEIAAHLADAVWITSDNPRGEAPELIASEIEDGMPRPYPAEVHLQLDREHAIAEAAAELQQGDTLIVAGKGHEPYMEIAGQRTPWSDADIISRYLHIKDEQGGLRACA
ncbi:MAG: Mur ligase family protein [Mariprofundaceae bacterium]